jgi:hypothetical protein
MIYKKLKKLQILSRLIFANILYTRGKIKVVNIVFELELESVSNFFYSEIDFAYFTT